MSETITSPIVGRHELRFLIILFGTLEYDGRVQRMIQVLEQLGKVSVVDVVDLEMQTPESSVGFGLKRYSVKLPRTSGRFTKHLRFACAALRAGLRFRPDVVVAENFFTTWAAWLVAKLTGATLIYDAYELIIPEPGRTTNLRKTIWYLMERFVVRRAPLVIAANEERARIMAAHYKLRDVPVCMRNIPHPPTNWPSFQEIVRRYPALLRRKPQERIILYQGYVSLERGLERFIRAVTYLPEEYRLVIVGDGPDLERIKVMSTTLLPGRLECVGKVPHHQLPAISACADVGIVTYSYEGLNNVYCASNKIFEYAQAGVPVVSTDQPPLKALVEEYGIGAVVARGDSPASIATILRRIADNKVSFTDHLARFVANNRWEDEVSRVRGRIEKLLQSRNRHEP